MSHSKSSDASVSGSLSFLERNPSLSDSLFADCNYNLNEVTTIIEPVLQAQKRCQITSFYVQAVTTGRTTFLVTNLPREQEVQVTAIASNWLLGRSPTCAITVQDKSVSRGHAVIGHHPSHGFYITDISSSNGTWVNSHRLAPMERQFLQDGDLVRFGSVRVEFFAASRGQSASQLSEATRS